MFLRFPNKLINRRSKLSIIFCQRLQQTNTGSMNFFRSGYLVVIYLIRSS